MGGRDPGLFCANRISVRKQFDRCLNLIPLVENGMVVSIIFFLHKKKYPTAMKDILIVKIKPINVGSDLLLISN